MSHKKTWRKLERIILSGRSQSEKAAYCRVPTIGYSGTAEDMETVKASIVARGRGGKDE